MRYNQLGRTGLYVSELCLGAMTFGGGTDNPWRIWHVGSPPDPPGTGGPTRRGCFE